MRESRQIEAFLDAQAAETDAARNTRLAYARDLRDYRDWLSTQRTKLSRAKKEDIERFLVHCEEQGLSRSTRARRLSAIRQFYRFAHEERWRRDNPAIEMKGPAREKRLPKTLSEEEVERLLKRTRRHGGKIDRIRNACMMELLYATGMRVSELVSLPLSAAKGKPRMLLIAGKGGKERLVPLSKPARKALRAWVAQRDEDEEAARAKGEEPSRYLFPSRGKSGHLSRHRFYMLVRELATAAGIPASRATPHVLRHAFATHMLAGGADLRTLQTLLGHTSIASTGIYTHVLEERKRDLVMEKHPLADGG